MKKNYENLIKSIKHLEALEQTFSNKFNFSKENDWKIYKQSYENLNKLISDSEIEMHKQLYDEKARQMILADVIEYIFFGRGYYTIITPKSWDTQKRRRSKFIKIILYFTNLLMCYESITIDINLRKKFLENLKKTIPEIEGEELFGELLDSEKYIGLGNSEFQKRHSQEEKYRHFETEKKINKYFDKLLPKTAGGLWHELLVFAFLLRYDLGYIIPLLLHQKLLSGSGNLSPPDFLIITKNKNIYGIEVGRKKEIQSGSFSLMTNIPTATLDTIGSRMSDRCPICGKWLLLCPYIIDNFSNLDKTIENLEVKCLEAKCPYYSPEEIVKGECPYTKYRRKVAKTRPYTQHKFADGFHYHYKCVLENLSQEKKELLINTNDVTALKADYPYYSGLEMLFKNKNNKISRS